VFAGDAQAHISGGVLEKAGPNIHVYFGACAFRMRECSFRADQAPPSAIAPYIRQFWRRYPMKFRPLGDRVVVRRLAEDQKSPGGIIIPETAQEKPQEGEVIAVGPGAWNDMGKRVVPEVKAGEFVLFGKWSGSEVKIDGEELLIMKESDLLGVLEARRDKPLRKAA
jgi:chaperonin GroES